MPAELRRLRQNNRCKFTADPCDQKRAQDERLLLAPYTATLAAPLGIGPSTSAAGMGSLIKVQ